MRVIELPDREMLASFEICDEDRPFNDEEFFEFCATNSDLRIERLANGKIVIMPPAGPESSHRNFEISGQLRDWAKKDGRGVGFDSSGQFFLESGAAYAADAAWILKSRMAKFTKEQKKRFLHICPDFVIELRSPSDRMPKLKAKMEDWMRNGAHLGWLIDADRSTVFIYRPGQPAEEVRGADAIDGEGPVAGFRLDLSVVWEGL